MKKSRVAIVHSTYNDMYRAVSRIMELLEYEPEKNGIFIKPNLVDRFHPRKCVTTHPEFVEGLIIYFRRHYPHLEIIVGDGCAIDINYNEVVKKTGFEKLCKKYDVKLVDLAELKRKKVQFGDRHIMVPKILDTHEYINVPKMKTHIQTTVSLGAKNQKGLLDNGTKKKFHRNFDLHKSIMKLADTIQPDLVITDAVMSLEGDGPTDMGEPRHTGLVIASTSIHAHDHAAARCMGFDPKTIEHIKSKVNYRVVGEDIEQSIRPHLKARTDYLKVANIYIGVNDTMCTQCAVTFKELMELKWKNLPFLLRVLWHGGFKDAKYVLFGKQNGKVHDIENTITFGNCAREKGSPLLNIPGCPPTLKEMQERYIEFVKKN